MNAPLKHALASRQNDMTDHEGDLFEGIKTALYVEALVVVVVFLMAAVALNTQAIFGGW